MFTFGNVILGFSYSWGKNFQNYYNPLIQVQIILGVRGGQMYIFLNVYSSTNNGLADKTEWTAIDGCRIDETYPF